MTPGVPHAARVRAYLAGLVVTAGLCGVAYRAWALQVDEGDHYRELAARQHASNVNIPAPRGDVVDARGRPLAVSADADSVWANPREIKDVTDTADKLATILGMEATVLEDKLAADKKFVFYCASGWRSALAAKTAQDMGLEKVAHVAGGYTAWKKAGGETEMPAPRQ